ncbi:MAG TPA: DUF58 domain-containing protein [Planctomycetes bacterium]|nr:DUF58 domain-containing protein [Planctomycetota bacterium]
MSPAASSTALDPAVLDRLAGLSLVARTVVEGFMSGQHRSPQRGSSVEFAQHRPYVRGDELRHIDWKIFARTDRLTVKEFVEETNFTCHLMVDASESMAFGSRDWTKLDYARWCAASLAYLVIRQRDAASISVFDSEMREQIPPSNGAHQVGEIARLLEAAHPDGRTNLGEVLHSMAGRLSRRGIVCVFSDFFDDIDPIVSGLRRLTHAGHEPILFQVLDPMELDFDLENLRQLQGLEGSGRIKIDPKAIRQAYREEIERHRAELARQANALSCDFVPLVTSEPVDVALSTYLAHRIQRARKRS